MESQTQRCVDIVVTSYNERDEALVATIDACLDQTDALTVVHVVDDGSVTPIDLAQLGLHNPRVSLQRFSQNRGISAARNFAVADTTSEFVACVNAEVVAARDWLSVGCDYLERNSAVGAVCTATVPSEASGLATQWRLAYQTEPLPDQDGPTKFAPGDAVLFRRTALDAVGGYDEKLRRIHEDHDICKRMRRAGWETHFVSGSRCVSIQVDTIRSLARKDLVRGGFNPGLERATLTKMLLAVVRRTTHRIGADLIRRRWRLIPMELCIAAAAAIIAVQTRSRDGPLPT